MTAEDDQRLSNIIRHVLVMGRGSFDTPEDWTQALLKRLDREGYRIIPKKAESEKS